MDGQMLIVVVDLMVAIDHVVIEAMTVFFLEEGDWRVIVTGMHGTVQLGMVAAWVAPLAGIVGAGVLCDPWDLVGEEKDGGVVVVVKVRE